VPLGFGVPPRDLLVPLRLPRSQLLLFGPWLLLQLRPLVRPEMRFVTVGIVPTNMGPRLARLSSHVAVLYHTETPIGAKTFLVATPSQ